MLLATAVSSAPVDSVHRHMEPAMDLPRSPRLRSPLPQGGLSGALALTPQRAAVLLPAAIGGMAIACPDLLAKVLVQLICFIGSLLEPFDMILPAKGLLRTMVTTVQRAKKAYNVKHGLVSIDEQQFFDDEDEAEAVIDDDAENDSVDASASDAAASDDAADADAGDATADASDGGDAED